MPFCYTDVAMSFKAQCECGCVPVTHLNRWMVCIPDTLSTWPSEWRSKDKSKMGINVTLPAGTSQENSFSLIYKEGGKGEI